MSRWFIYNKKADFQDIARRFHLSVVTARLIRNRDIVGDSELEKYLHGNVNDLYSPYLLKDAESTADILIGKIWNRKKIRVIGDYDVDGIMSSFIFIHALTQIGGMADLRIPDRVFDGYGLNVSLVDEAFRDGIDTLLTCDNGIAAADQVEKARAMGMTVIVTDHHEVPFTGTGEEKTELPPPADAVVDPKQKACGYPYKALCGASVAWKIISIVYDKIGKPAKESLRYLPYAAIATIADVCDLTDENRIIVREGLKALPGIDNIGLKELILQQGLKPDGLGVYQIGFVIAPCLNAVGRLDTAMDAFRLLMTKNPSEAARLAEHLINLNAVRKDLTVSGFDKAVQLIESSAMKDDPVLVVYLDDCTESVAGIIAGRIREKYYKPCLILTDAEEGVKGSGRSIEPYDMFAEMSRCSDLFTKFGGHPMACGFSMAKEDIAQLRERLNRNYPLTPEEAEEKVMIDMRLPFRFITGSLIREFSALEPFGKGNPKPLFALKGVRAQRVYVAGKNKNVLRMTVRDADGSSIEAVCFRFEEETLQNVQSGAPFDITFYPEINTFRGQETVEIVITSFYFESPVAMGRRTDCLQANPHGH